MTSGATDADADLPRGTEYDAMSRPDLLVRLQTLDADLRAEQTAHAETRTRLDTSEQARDRAVIGRDMVLSESRATKTNLQEAQLAAWRAKRQLRYARCYAAAAALITIAALMYAATD